MNLDHVSVPQRRLIGTLTEARLHAGLTGVELASQCGWKSQAKVSKIENGASRPSPEDVGLWLNATGVTDEAERAAAIDLADLIAAESVRWKEVDRHGLAAQQRARGAREAEASTIRIYQSKVIPGLAQTPDYTRHLLLDLGRDPEQVEDAVRARLERQQVLYDGSKTIEMVIQESVLRWRRWPAAINVGQLDRLLTIAALPNVSIGIVSDAAQETGRTATSFVLKHGEDHAELQIELLSRELTITDAADITEHDHMFAYQQSLAVYDADATDLIKRACDYLRTQK